MSIFSKLNKGSKIMYLLTGLALVFGLLFSTMISAEPIVTSDSYELVSSERISNTEDEYTYKLRLTNTSDTKIYGYTATVESSSRYTTIVDDEVTFENINKNESEIIVSDDTFTIKQNRRKRFNPDNLKWEIKKIPDLSKGTFKFSKSPLNKESSIIFETEEDLSRALWSINEEVTDNEISFTVLNENSKIVFTPTKAGTFIVKIKYENQNREMKTSFLEILPYNPIKFKPSKYSNEKGIITNQFWIDSTNSQDELLRFLSDKYPDLIVVGTRYQRILIEIDESDTNSLMLLESLKIESEVQSVMPRVYEKEGYYPTSETSYLPNLTLPDDGSNFNDDGDNWHLEKINIEKAWDITKGSEDLIVFISDN